ncbi:type I toxin-antitoxin system Ibs family toxin, partial [Pseudomonas aeruginosa]
MMKFVIILVVMLLLSFP